MRSGRTCSSNCRGSFTLPFLPLAVSTTSRSMSVALLRGLADFSDFRSFLGDELVRPHREMHADEALDRARNRASEHQVGIAHRAIADEAAGGIHVGGLAAYLEDVLVVFRPRMIAHLSRLRDRVRDLGGGPRPQVAP